MVRIIAYFLACGSFCSGQSHEQLMRYSEHYDRDINGFVDFMKIEPSVSRSNEGVTQMVFELDHHNVGVEEHSTKKGRIREIYVYQTSDNRGHAFSEWNKCLDVMMKDSSMTFVKAVFDDGIVKENDLTLDELQLLLASRNLNTNRSYGVRFNKVNAYLSLFIIKGKLVFTIDDKNY